MKRVYLLLRQRGVNFGHGDSGTSWEIGGTYTPFQPVFLHREAAERHRDSLPEHQRTSLVVTPIEFREEP
jgi:hypothetical protein